MEKKRIKIRAAKDGPYMVEDCSELKGSQGERLSIDPYAHLCRCGKSGNKPFCDNTHEEYGFRSAKLDGRQPDRTDRYEGKEIVIFDNRGVCSHRGHCTDNLPDVFLQGKEPWIDPDGADPKEIARVVRMCPSGALSYEWGGEYFNAWGGKPEITFVKNAPLEVRGEVELTDEEGNVPQTGDHYALCRCGGSKNKPFCDGTHWYNGFSDKKEPCRPVKPAKRHMDTIHHMAASGKGIHEPMGTEIPLPSWDSITIHGAQLHKLPVNEDEEVSLRTVIGPGAARPLSISMPVYITHMSYGALSAEAKIALARGAENAGTAICSGEGGILAEEIENAGAYIFEYVQNEYSVTDENLQRCDALEIKIGQAVKPGIGGHFPAEKITEEIAAVRNRPRDRDIVTSARYPDITSPEELKTKVDWLRSHSRGRPIGIKIAAGNIEDDLAFILPAGLDFITLDGEGGATGSVPKMVKDSSSVPTVYAIGRARRFLDKMGAKKVSLVVTGGLRVSSDFVKALALGADAVAIGTAALMAIGCRQYRMCHTGRCPTGITSQDQNLRSRIDIGNASKGLSNFLQVTKNELEIFTRMTGHRSISELSAEDISCTSYDIACAAGISFSGGGRRGDYT